MKRIVIICVIMCLLAGCASTLANEPTTAAGQLQGSTPLDTTPEETTPRVTTPAETTPVVTTPGTTTPTKTTPVATTPVPTTPSPTEPTHTHDYTKHEVVAPTCEKNGYTAHTCTCGHSYTDATTPKTGHNYTKGNTVAPTCTTDGYTTYYCTNKGCTASYREDKVPALGHDMQLAESKAATTTEEGYEIWKCAHEGCNKTETKTLDKIPEVIDIAALVAYGRSYAASQGYEVVIGLRDGYYPGILCYIDTMEQGRADVREAVDSQTGLLEARGLDIHDARFDIKIDDLGNGQYRVWTYYG